MAWQIESHFFIAQLGKAHGIKGELKLKILSPNPDVFDYLEEVILFSPNGENELATYTMEELRGEPVSIIKLSGVSDRSQAEQLNGHYLAVRREDASPLEEGEYYIADLIGMEVIDETRGVIGTLRNVIDGASPVLQIQRPGKKDLYMPKLGGHFKNADLETGKIEVSLPEGLWEIYD